MPKPIIQFDEKKLLAQMKRYEEVIGKEVGQQVRNYSRLFALDLMRQTEPFDQKKKPEGRIMRGDLLRAFRVLAAREYRKAEAIKSNGGQYTEVEHYPDRKRFWVDVNNDFLSGEAAMRQHHQSQRRKGRVPKGAKNATVKESDFKKYEKSVLKMIGYAKAGWAAAAQKMNADTKAAAKGTGIPAWVKKLIPLQSPDVRDLTRDKRNPRVRFNSSVSFMSNVLASKSISASANITRGKMANFLRRAIAAELRKAKHK